MDNMDDDMLSFDWSDWQKRSTTLWSAAGGPEGKTSNEIVNHEGR